MSDQPSPSSNRILWTTIATLIAALLLLVLVVMPAEYGVDPTGFGGAVGLTGGDDENVEVIEIRDVLGGNETLREVEIPDAGEPTPLPNPAVFQDQPQAASSQTLEIELPVDGQTEVKLYMEEGKVAIYSWSVNDGNDIYVDFHGHDQSFGSDFFVRYKEQQQGNGNHGSLTAPFSGEHGWYWLNTNEHPVTITLEVTGFYDDLIDYGLF